MIAQTRAAGRGQQPPSACERSELICAPMPDYKKLRDMVSHRVTFEFDTGAKIVGYIGSCAPPQGAVQLVVLSKAQFLDSANNVVAKYDELPMIPNNLVGFRITEGPL